MAFCSLQRFASERAEPAALIGKQFGQNIQKAL
jgi:hypothetical protein